MSHLHLVIGPVGSGKSTFALQLSRKHQAIRMTLDEWMAELFGGDERPSEGRMQWYMDRTDRCLEQIWRLAENLMDLGTDVVLEVGLIQSAARQAFYARIDQNSYEHTVYVVDASRDVRRERVLQRNRDKGGTFSMEVPLEVFELASDLWEPPEEGECSDRTVRFTNG